MGYKNMLFDVMVLNMEKQMTELAQERFGKSIADCTNDELFDIVLTLVKRILAVSERNTGEKKLYYISAEFLTGRLLTNNLVNLGLYGKMSEILEKYDKHLADIEELEPEPALGSGGLGRLSACLLDAIATAGMNAEGIGLNYHYGMFRQKFQDLQQYEEKDAWSRGKSWEIPNGISFDVWFGNRKVTSKLYEISICGQGSGTNQIRLFDLESVDDSLVRDGITFDKEAIARNLTLFMYPDDSDQKGRILRIYQQYFLVSNAAQMILREMKSRKYDLRRFSDYAVIQINGTHGALIIPEMIRILVEEKALSFIEAVSIIIKVFAYTNHTVLQESLETWKLQELQEVIPQLVPIIHRLDRFVKSQYPDQPEVWVIDEDEVVHMAKMCIHFGFSVNGVSKVHTKVLTKVALRGFYEIYPHKFHNISNGISFRRWLLSCNRPLVKLLCKELGNDFKRDPSLLLALMDKNENLLTELAKCKADAKHSLAMVVREREQVELIEHGIYDMQITRIHEQKRQLMNALYIIHKYLEIKRGIVPKRPINFIFGGKAAPSYTLAKDVIHLLLVLQQIINSDADVNRNLRVLFVTNYNVEYAEKLIPACDISEQISLASKEASGTCGMKMILNGAVIVGTKDGSNEEILERVGADNIYIFGEDTKAILGHEQRRDYSPRGYYNRVEIIREAVDFITGPQMLHVGNEKQLSRLSAELKERDQYMSLLDFEDYVCVKDKMLRDYEDRMGWGQKMLIGIANSGYFSADRTISDYNREIWELHESGSYT